MKQIKMKSLTVLVLVLMIIGGTGLFAQRGQGMGTGAGYGYGMRAGTEAGYGIGYGLNLTEDQQNQIEKMRIAHLKAVQPVRDELMELRAHQRTLMNAEKSDQRYINKNIDEMTKLQNKLMKMGSEFHLKVRSILTDEQKVLMQTRQGRAGRFGKGMRTGRGPCMMNGSRYSHGSKFQRFGYRGYSPWNAPDNTVNK